MPRFRRNISRKCEDCFSLLNYLCRNARAKEFWRHHTHGYVSFQGEIEVYDEPADDSKPLQDLGNICPYWSKDEVLKI